VNIQKRLFAGDRISIKASDSVEIPQSVLRPPVAGSGLDRVTCRFQDKASNVPPEKYFGQSGSYAGDEPALPKQL